MKKFAPWFEGHKHRVAMIPKTVWPHYVRFQRTDLRLNPTWVIYLWFYADPRKNKIGIFCFQSDLPKTLL